MEPRTDAHIRARRPAPLYRKAIVATQIMARREANKTRRQNRARQARAAVPVRSWRRQWRRGGRRRRWIWTSSRTRGRRRRRSGSRRRCRRRANQEIELADLHLAPRARDEHELQRGLERQRVEDRRPG